MVNNWGGFYVLDVVLFCVVLFMLLWLLMLVLLELWFFRGDVEEGIVVWCS